MANIMSKKYEVRIIVISGINTGRAVKGIADFSNEFQYPFMSNIQYHGKRYTSVYPPTF